MKQYKALVQKILDEGMLKQNRTGIDTLSISGFMFEHNMADGFPLLTTKKMGLKTIATELEFFIKGYSDKRWLQDRNCHIWDSWCDPKIVPYSNDEQTKLKMRAESSLGRVYGVQWRNWRKLKYGGPMGLSIEHIDQLKNSIETLKKDPTSRRNIVMAWNPSELDQMALPPCHFMFQLISDGITVDLLWSQRSVDVPLGLPFNIASYALLLEAICNEVVLIPGKLIGFLADCHIYVNQIDLIKEQMEREEFKLPTLKLPFGVFDFDSTSISSYLKDYNCHPAIKFPEAAV